MAKVILLRVRTRAGTWRVPGVDPNCPLKTLVERLEQEQRIKVAKVSLKQNFSDEVPLTKTPSQLGLKNGAMIFVEVAGGTIVVGNTRREVDANGKLVSTEAEKKGFLPGLQALGDQKQSWTLTEMAELQERYTFKVTGRKPELCGKAELDTSACESFSQYVSDFLHFESCRVGILYGKVVASEAELRRKAEEESLENIRKKEGFKYGVTKGNMKIDDLANKYEYESRAKHAVVVDAIYEPAQKNFGDRFELLDDTKESGIDEFARILGLEKVGIIFAHPRSSEYVLKSEEIITAAEFSLIANKGERETPFILVKVSKSLTNNIEFEAFSLTELCLDMVAEGALGVLKDNPSHCSVVEPFVAIVEGKEAHVIDTDVFIKPVPIANFDSVFSEKNIGQHYVRLNRTLDVTPSGKTLKEYIRSITTAKRAGAITDAEIQMILSNFHVLTQLSQTIGLDEGLRDICLWLKRRAIENDLEGAGHFPDGYKLMLMNIATLE